MSLVNYTGRDRFFDDFFNDDWFAMPLIKRQREQLSLPTMNVDFMENEKDYVLHAEIPGCKKEDINLCIDNGVLTMEVQKEESKEEKKSNYYHKERSWGKTQRSIRLPVNADKDNVSVGYKDGVLTLTFPKKEGANAPKKLTIA
jgi:HSP20 family protein